MNALVAWYFIAVWGAGYVATKAGLQYAPPFTFLSLRFAFGLLCLAPVLLLFRTRWPQRPVEWAHLVVAGLLMHVVQLGGSHYAQYLGMSAGVAALVISCQPLVMALIAVRFLGERLAPRQWLGVLLGLAGVALVVWHKIDIHEVSAASLACTLIALAGVTAGTLYQRAFSPHCDLKAAAAVQFTAATVAFVPLALAVEGFRVTWAPPLAASIVFLVVFTSLLGVSALYWLTRQGDASRVTSMMYLPAVFAVVLEWAAFGVAPGSLAAFGIALTCLGVGLTVWKRTWKSSTSSA
ncbi:MAG TPA: DMT family transporter [Burkholderiales bacterium]|jgi:drug/metabolite transporter (DMT)-like permease